MKKITLLILMFIVVELRSQSVYEIKFQGQIDKIQYTCLLVYYNEDNCYMRIGYFNPKNEYRVVNIKYVANNGTWTDGRSFFSLTGSSVDYVTAKNDDESYNPDYFVWINNEPLPYTTDESPSQNPERTVYRVNGYKKLDKQSFTESYLQQFYKSSEEDYVSFRKMATVEVDHDNYNVTLHLIVLANTDIRDIGSGCGVDLLNLNTEFEEIAKTLNISYSNHLIYGEDFNKGKLLETLNSLSVNPSDVVIFVYRGHGFRWNDQESKYPSCALTRSQTVPLSNNNTIAMESIYNTIVAKGGRLNLVIADCCNSNIGANQNATDNYLFMQSNASGNYEKLYDLFINREGSLLSSASDVGEVSWTNGYFGGFFTTSFLQALSEEVSYLKDTESSWVNIISNTRTIALNKSHNCSNCSPQHAISLNQITKK